MEDAAPDVRARSPLMMLVIVALAVALAGGVAFYVWQRLAEPPAPKLVCRGLVARLGGDEATMQLLRHTFPPDFRPPEPGQLETLVGHEQVADTAENVCRYQLYVWENAAPDHEAYATLVGCLDGAADRDAASRCYDALAR